MKKSIRKNQKNLKNDNLINGVIENNGRIKLIKDSKTIKKIDTLFSKNLFGKELGNEIFLNLFEAIYLINSKKLKVLKKNQEMSQNDLINIGIRNEKFFLEKSTIFTHLRKLGYLLRPAFKYGVDFLVYDKKSDFFKEHSKWMLKAYSSTYKLSSSDFCAYNRVSHSVNKKLLLCFVNKDLNLSFFETGWVKL